MHATTEQLANAYEELSDDEHDSIRDYAARHIRGTSFAEPEDLIQETLTRAVAGTRKWPLHVPFSLFLRLAMRSVAHADWTSQTRLLIVPLPEDFNINERIADTHACSSVENRLLLLERLAQAEQVVAHARAALGEDLDAQRVIDGILWGASPKETRAELDANERDFDAARQRASRRLRQAIEIVQQRVEPDENPARKTCGNVRAASRASAAPTAKARKAKR